MVDTNASRVGSYEDDVVDLGDVSSPAFVSEPTSLVVDVIRK